MISSDTFSAFTLEQKKGECVFMNDKGLSQLPSPAKIFIVSYMVLIAVGMLLALWVVRESSVWRGSGGADPMAGMPKEAIEAAKAAQFYSYLKQAHIHHLGHVFIVFSVAGIYAFTRGRNSLKTQIIIWTAIITLFHTLGFLIYSRLLLIFFGTAYGGILAYMMAVIVIDCYRPIRESEKTGK